MYLHIPSFYALPNFDVIDLDNKIHFLFFKLTYNT